MTFSVVFNTYALVPHLHPPPLLFSFYFVSLDNGVKEIDPYEGLYIKKDLFCSKNLWGGAVQTKINQTAIDVSSLT